MVNAAWIYKLNSTIYRCLSLFTAILAGAVDVDIPRGEIRIKDQSAYHTLAVLGEITIELGQADPHQGLRIHNHREQEENYPDREEHNFRCVFPDQFSHCDHYLTPETPNLLYQRILVAGLAAAETIDR